MSTFSTRSVFLNNIPVINCVYFFFLFFFSLNLFKSVTTISTTGKYVLLRKDLDRKKTLSIMLIDCFLVEMLLSSGSISTARSKWKLIKVLFN